MDDDDEDLGFKIRAAGGTKKKKKKNQGDKGASAQLYAVGFGGCFLISWGITASFLLLNLGFMYNFITIPQTRAHYCVSGAAQWAKSTAADDLLQAVNVWHILNSSVAGLIWRSPQDFTNLGNVLSPAFETMPLLHSVELGFSDRSDTTVVTRRKGALSRGSWSFVKSNSPECYLMGTDGCFGKTGIGTYAAPPWYTFAATLRETPNGGVFYWWQKPEVVVETQDDGPDLLSPAIRLSFKATFPTYRKAGPRWQMVSNRLVDNWQPTQVLGRISLKLAALSGNRLVDKQMGDGKDGSIYLCDSTGAVLASKTPNDVMTVQNGIVRFKYLWEVEKQAARGSLREAFTGSSVKETEEDEDSFVAIEPLDAPLARFAIVVVARSWPAFQSTPLIALAGIAAGVAPTPYVILTVMAVAFVCGQCISTMVKNDGNVGGDGLKGRVSIAATMARTSVSHMPVGEEEEKTTKRKFSVSGGFRKVMSFTPKLF